MGKKAQSDLASAECGAVGPSIPCDDPDLAAVIGRWSSLTDKTKTNILALIRETTP
jgi:hypothetical protein